MACQVMITREENWFVATETSTNVASQGKSIIDALKNLKEALELYYGDGGFQKNCSKFFENF